ncbi:MAG: hypothetical protein QMC93_01700 [Patescibacteria group bacterium]|nr:hypothetical protein [Patescibacteria group bacterium]
MKISWMEVSLGIAVVCCFLTVVMSLGLEWYFKSYGIPKAPTYFEFRPDYQNLAGIKEELEKKEKGDWAHQFQEILWEPVVRGKKGSMVYLLNEKGDPLHDLPYFEIFFRDDSLLIGRTGMEVLLDGKGRALSRKYHRIFRRGRKIVGEIWGGKEIIGEIMK